MAWVQGLAAGWQPQPQRNVADSPRWSSGGPAEERQALALDLPVADRRSCVFPRADAQRMACRQPACHLSTRRSRTFRHPEGGLEKHAFCASYTKRARSVAAPAGARMGTCGAEGAPSMIGAGPAGGWCTSFQSAALGGNNAHRARGPRRHAPPPAARGPSPRPPARGWGCARGGGRLIHGLHGVGRLQGRRGADRRHAGPPKSSPCGSMWYVRYREGLTPTCCRSRL